MPSEIKPALGGHSCTLVADQLGVAENVADRERARSSTRIAVAAIMSVFVVLALWLMAVSFVTSVLISSSCCAVIVVASSVSDLVEAILDAIAAVVFGVLAAIAAVFAAIFSLVES